ncbi:zf-HIT domain-containing protein/PAPA-1 domain-containing protein [Cephalotus follicularis]|uniref:Zf-HIT domain-containing protein/PAPA-1 domain-containing protein n=1 Tax=Cephalotus follicularis TaxID=3775 RepID=A0A1Q3CZW4_CEPFO|nr:zf-HIT domain-containing protein/PAPA-1 domain-containing protein [Cephalotus follicularis]
MESFGGLGFSHVSSAVRKKRSNASRRPRNDFHIHSDFHDILTFSSTPPLDNNMINKEDRAFGESDEASNNSSFQGRNKQRCGEGFLDPTNWTCPRYLGHLDFSGGSGIENSIKKVKLKVGGVTHTINAKSTLDDCSGVGSTSTKFSCFSPAPQPWQKLSGHKNSGKHPSFTSVKRDCLQGLPCRDFSRGNVSVGKTDISRGRMPVKNISMKPRDKYDPVRKSKRIPKNHSLDGVLDDGGGDDEENGYLEKVKTLKESANYGAENDSDEEGGSRKHRKISNVLKRNVDGLCDVYVGDHGSLRSGRESKRTKSREVSENADYIEEEPVSDGETESKGRTAKEFVDFLGCSKKNLTVTTRQRALQTGKDGPTTVGASLIEFPNGLPLAPPRRSKEKLSEVEQQLKNAEAAQKRRMKNEKAAQESEAEAIRKILGQDSTRKKQEEKIRQRHEALAQKKAANAMILASNTIRWIMGPSGTIVTFSSEVGLPSIFDPKTCSYPPPREICAAPSCTNPYKYRDSKFNLPLCSLQCYKAMHEKISPVTAC